jgi:hypothetical protein
MLGIWLFSSGAESLENVRLPMPVAFGRRFLVPSPQHNDSREGRVLRPHSQAREVLDTDEY